MSTAFQLLRNKVEFLAQNSQFNASASILLKHGLDMSIDELIQVPYSDSAEIYCFRSLIIFLRYSAEAPKGSAYQFLREEYINFLSLKPNDCKIEVSPFTSKIYLEALSKELNVAKLSDLEVWLETYEYLKTKNVEIQFFEENLLAKLSRELWEIIEEKEKNLKKCIECASIASFAQSKGLNLTDIVNLFISSIYEYLTCKYEIYNGGKKNILEISNLVYFLKKFILVQNNEKIKVNQLEDFFGAIPCPAEQEEQSRADKVFNRDPKLKYASIDFTTLIFIATVYASTSNPNYNIIIHHYKCSNKGDIALKVYEIKNPDFDLNIIKNEVDILETLSNMVTQSSCFIKYNGSCWDQGKIYISMELVFCVSLLNPSKIT